MVKFNPITDKRKRIFNILLIMVLWLLVIAANSFPAFAELIEKGADRYFSDRFIFLGWLYNKPLITTITFNRGFSESGKFKYIAEFQGYLLFAGKWHNMKNGNYIETDTPFDIREIPDYKPCLMRWKETSKSGAINYEHQLLSFLLQFRNIRQVDIMGREPDFTVTTGVGEAVLQFQGAQVPGVLIFQHKDLSGYNRLAHNFNHLKCRKLEQFFLLGQDNDIYIIRAEQEGNKISGQLIPHNRVIHIDKDGSCSVLPGNAGIKWIDTEKENNPDSKFRIYPVAWEISMGVPEEKIQLTNESGFYWFSYGLSGVRGALNGRLIMGLAEIIRGE